LGLSKKTVSGKIKIIIFVEKFLYGKNERKVSIYILDKVIDFFPNLD